MRRNGQRLAAGRPNEQNSEQQRRLKKENAELMEQYIEQYEQKLKREKQQAKTLEEIKGLESELAFKELVTDVLTKQLDEARKETDEERKAKEEERKAKEEERKEKEKQKESSEFYRGQANRFAAERDTAETERDAAVKDKTAFIKDASAFFFQNPSMSVCGVGPSSSISCPLGFTPHSAHLKDQPKKMEEEQLENVDEEGGEDNIHKKGDIIIVGRPSLEEELKLLEKSADIEDTTSGSNATTPADHLPDQQVVLQCRDEMMDISLGQTNERKSGADDNNTKNSDIVVGQSLEKVLKPLNKSPAKEDTKRSRSIGTASETKTGGNGSNPKNSDIIVGSSFEQELKLLEKSPAKEDTKRGSSTATTFAHLPHQQVVNPCQDQMIAIPLGSTEETDTETENRDSDDQRIRSAEKSAPSLTRCALGKSNIGQMVDT
ncbi:hypothetical protein niasHT_033200 [Heterodera trifolii]|uniref:Uncharacterized protein n=1 Tax=Heterodera trifolii TaxID=157864 RepID=A0ABD2HZU9_9BILA